MVVQQGEQSTSADSQNANRNANVPLSPKGSKEKESCTKRKSASIVWDHFTIVEGTRKVPIMAECNYCKTGFKCERKGHMQVKFDKYWDVEKINLLLYAALVLDPRFKMKYVRFCLSSRLEFESSKVDHLVSRVKDAVISLHDWHLLNHSSSLQLQNMGESSQGLSSDHSYSDDDDMSLADDFQKHLEEEDNLVNKSEVERYLAEVCEQPKIGHFDILEWWRANSSRYQILSHVARDVLVILISSVASEFAFSTGRRILDCFCSSLAPTTVEALIYSQDCLRPSMVPINLRESMNEVEELEKLDKELLGGSNLHLSFVEE